MHFAEEPLPPFQHPAYRRNALFFAIPIMLITTGALWLVLTGGALLCRASGNAVGSPTEGSDGIVLAPPDILHSWAAYTPYFSAEPYSPPPSDCKITQVNIIQRHGARFPTSGATMGIVAAVNKLLAATSYADPRMDFLRNYTYSLGVADLVPFGALQSAEAGARTYHRYSKLVSKKNIPFVRSSSGQRVVDSATNWTAGFSLASNHVYNPPLSVILDEDRNDTLDDNMCPNAGDSDTQTEIWTNIFGAPIATRLNAQALGANLTATDISFLMPLCAFDSIVREAPSPFCDLFTPAEFAQYEYYGDLDKYYGTGYGQELGPVQGVGYINELLARLTETPVQDETQTNRTLDADPATFPPDRTIYADFSHDNQMVAIYAAIGLFPQPQPLDPTMPDPERTWVTSRLTPFSGRMVTERLTCKKLHGSAGVKGGKTPASYVRILVNDALQPLEFCGARGDGLCELGAFVTGQAYARNNGEGDFEKCFS
ncbi:hypothetical protein NLJ89_g7102 [Agrocybe chaxingu]|uniref:Phytase A n=1 Tax=Agrocybe chaxingu TaxID=84603 RepID=A0A9W8MU06_9AGAR|nr:hypothetical protein NLJ89_g7102 [Agrocybe chaxingu]